MVVMKPFSTPTVSCETFATGAREVVVHRKQQKVLALRFHDGPQKQPADAAKSVDRDAKCHVLPPGMLPATRGGSRLSGSNAELAIRVRAFRRQERQMLTGFARQA